MSEVVTISMVTEGAQVHVGTVTALPANPIQRRSTTTITHHTVMLDTCVKLRPLTKASWLPTRFYLDLSTYNQ